MSGGGVVPPDPKYRPPGFGTTPRDQTPGAAVTSVAQSLIAKVSGAFKNLMTSSGGAPPGNSLVPAQRRDPWFGPGVPMTPQAPAQDVAGRRLDYDTGHNLTITTRRHEGVTFEQLRALSRFDMVRLAIETRKDQMASLTGSVLPRMTQTDELRGKPDDRCQKIMDFLQYPDKRFNWADWSRQLVDEQLVTDAPSIYIRKTVGGEVYSLELVKGDTIVPKIDVAGRMPLPPDIAYQQVLKGSPAINYTSDELIYAPRNMTVDRYVGYSPVEQIIMTVSIAIRREVQKLNYFTEGNVPEAIISLPPEWTSSMVAEFQLVWDALLRNPTSRDGKVRFVPGPMTFTPTRSDATLFGQFDEWLARVICYAFSLPALPFVQQQNRATAETANEAALEEGLSPMMIWFKGVMDRIIQNAFGYTDLEWVWDDVESIDTAEQARQDLAEMQVGLVSGDEIRAKRGLPPIGMTHMIWGLGPLGIMSVDDVNKAMAAGLAIPQPPPPPGMAPGMAPGQPMPGQPGAPGGPSPQPMLGGPGAPPAAPPMPRIAPETQEAFAHIPPQLLAAVGLGPGGSAARTVDVTDAHENQSDPLRHAAAHPQVLRTLRAAQQRRLPPAKRGQSR